MGDNGINNQQLRAVDFFIGNRRVSVFTTFFRIENKCREFLLKYGIAVHKSHVMLLFDIARRDRKWMLTAPEVDSVNRS